VLHVAPSLYNLSIYALLHDIGKPILRFARRYILEKTKLGVVADRAKEAVESLFAEGIEAIASKRHDEISERVANYMLGVSLDEKDKKYFNFIISAADALAASERGLEPVRHDFMVGVQRAVAEEVKARAGLPYSYSHEYVPMLSTTWLLLKTGYINSVGLQNISTGTTGRWSGVNARREAAEKVFYPLQDAIERGDREAVTKVLADMLTELAQEPLWIPVRPLLPREVVELRAYSLREAMESTSYSEIALLLLHMLKKARSIYSSSPSTTRGFVDTIESILKATTTLVPSAIYWSLVPDISLYSHSKLVTALATASQLGREGRLRLLVIDANNIQGFIAAPVKAAAASRVMRGRSLLLELLLDALSDYALTLFGGMPQVNVLISEGGTIDILVPDLEDFGERVKKLRETGFELSKYLGGLVGFTVAYSEPFRVEDASFQRAVKALKQGPSMTSFIDVISSLSQSLAVEKARSGSRVELAEVGGVIARDTEIEDFDTLTGEPVFRGSDKDPFKLAIPRELSEELKNYVSTISGEKLEPGDTITTSTHLSLAIGTASRELTAILSIHVYRHEQGIAVPDGEALEAIYRGLHEKLKVGADVVGPLLILRKFAQEMYSKCIAFAPLKPVGALHILVSLPLRRAGIHDVEDPEFVDPLYEATYRIAGSVLSHLDSVLNSIDLSNRSIRIKIRFVNAPHLFIFTEAITSLYTGFSSNTVQRLSESFDELSKAVSKLIRRGADVVFSFTLLGLYHPAKYVAREGSGISDVKLVDLDEFGIIAVAKMDADMFGEVRALYSMSPSRLVTLSDLVNTVIAGKAYLKAVKIAKNLVVDGERRNLDVIPLYAGGDDITLYGKWSHVVYYVNELSRDIRCTLPPLSLSIGISIGDAKEPLLLLYRYAVHLLEEYAKSVRASCIIGAPYIVLYPSKPQPSGQEALYYVMPLEKPSRYYRWVEDPIAFWNLNVLAGVLGVLIGVEKREGLKEGLEKFKRELYILASIAHKYEEALDLYGLVKAGRARIEEFRARVLPIEILYAYTWSRRSDDLREVKELFEKIAECKSMLLQYPEEIVEGRSVEEALRLLLAAKPVLDLIILALRRYEDSVKPSKLIEVERRG
jgi:CRISPR-associated protein Csm1